jgi:hypothetical protein
VRVEQSFRHRACFLVHARVPRWQWCTGDGILPAWPALAPILRRAAEEADIDPDGPFPFRIAGQAAAGTIHVLDESDDAVRELELKKGDAAYAVIKASAVMVARD